MSLSRRSEALDLEKELPQHENSNHNIKIIMPTYKRLEMLKWAMKSILTQTYKNWTLYVGTDGEQEDNTIGFLQDIAASDKRVIHVHSEKKLGAHKTVEMLLDLIDGNDYVVCMADDDMIYPNCLLHHAVALEMFPDMDLSVGGWHFKNLNDDKVNYEQEVLLYHDEYQLIDRESDLKKVHRFNPYVLVACMYKKEVLRTLSAYETVYENPKYIQWDWLLTALVLTIGYKIVAIPYTIGMYTVRNIEQATNSQSWGRHFIMMWELLDANEMTDEHYDMLKKVVEPHVNKELKEIFFSSLPRKEIETKMLELFDMYYSSKEKMGYVS